MIKADQLIEYLRQPDNEVYVYFRLCKSLRGITAPDFDRCWFPELELNFIGANVPYKIWSHIGSYLQSC